MNEGLNTSKANTMVEVTWLDACSEESCLPLQAIRNMKPLTRKNVGYKLDMTASHVTITKGIIENLYHNETGYDGCLSIPRGMIVEIREIK